MKQRTLLLLLSLLGVMAPCLSGQGQSYEISWYTIDGGGGTSSGGAYTVSGTIGQPDAGQLTGGTYTLVGGFWGVVAAIQTPGCPLLSVRRSGGSIVISWPAALSGDCILQQNSNLMPLLWVPVEFQRESVGENFQITVPAPTGNSFYRLYRD